MRINILIIIAILYTFSFSCSDSGPDDSIPVIPKDSCLVYEYIKDSNSMINAYYKFDSTPGFGYATKVNMTTYFSSKILLSENLFQVHLISRDRDSFLTDYLGIIGFKQHPGCYSLNLIDTKWQIKDLPVAYFSNNDGDVVIDDYLLDTSHNTNKIEILSIDTVNRIIEGHFACSFVFANNRPKRSPYNLDSMRFFNGYFKGKYMVE
ncbi:MAG: hypothetical protein IPP06_15500 [Saprospiraceae bacterium]|nr:hypothetical protein [Candidatus Vicinibacter affinis]